MNLTDVMITLEIINQFTLAFRAIDQINDPTVLDLFFMLKCLQAEADTWITRTYERTDWVIRIHNQLRMRRNRLFQHHLNELHMRITAIRITEEIGHN